MAVKFVPKVLTFDLKNFHIGIAWELLRSFINDLDLPTILPKPKLNGRKERPLD